MNVPGTLTMAALAAVPLPSHSAAQKLVAGEPGGAAAVAGATALRAGIFAAGLYVTGPRRRHIVRKAVAGAVAVEVLILLWALASEPKAP